MEIDRKNVLRLFRTYTDRYDSSNRKIALKIQHTYRVAGLCERIARSLGLEAGDVDLAWLLGMLHDIGRFEQLRRYDTFEDAQSVDHAKLGAELLFHGSSAQVKGAEAKETQPGMIRDYVQDGVEDALIETAILVHSAYRVPEQLSPRVKKFCNILRDADKLDILRVSAEAPLEELYNTTKEELYHGEVSQAVMQSFYEHHATLRSLKRTTVDYIAAHVSFLYELVFQESFRIARKEGYWKKLIGFPSENPKTVEQLEMLRKEMDKFLEKATG